MSSFYMPELSINIFNLYPEPHFFHINFSLYLILFIKIYNYYFSNRFIHADVGMNGRISDGGVWSRSKFQKSLNQGKLNLPPANPFPFHIVGDNAFPLSCKLMKPYPQTALENCIQNRVFNYR